MSSVVPLGKYRTVIGNDYWADAATGNWQDDCQSGRARADRIFTCLRDHPEKHGTLMRGIRDMMGKGNWTAVEAGFFHRMAELAVIGIDTDASK